ncbi:MAG: thioredoxin domain-containing protein, partial [Crocosphaera sp.]|nr:thioredoxin domain-containing protein [Crocosphaera sp.]
MTAPQGYFYAAQDTDNFINADTTEPEERAFYTWGYGELLQLLTQGKLTDLQQEFTVTVSGNFEGHNVLQRGNYKQLSVILEATLSKLFS